MTTNPRTDTAAGSAPARSVQTGRVRLPTAKAGVSISPRRGLAVHFSALYIHLKFTFMNYGPKSFARRRVTN